MVGNAPEAPEQPSEDYRRGLVHWAAIAVAVVVALGLFVVMILGPNWEVPEVLGKTRTWRQIALALWAFLLPAWFTMEELWFGPKDKAQRESFISLQRKAQATWVVVAGVVAILIGTAPGK